MKPKNDTELYNTDDDYSPYAGNKGDDFASIYPITQAEKRLKKFDIIWFYG